jgi:hypothetical protein
VNFRGITLSEKSRLPENTYSTKPLMSEKHAKLKNMTFRGINKKDKEEN